MELDAIDQQFIRQFLAEDEQASLVEQVVVCVQFISPEGAQCFKTVHYGDVAVVAALGLLDCARMDIIDPEWKDRCPDVRTRGEDDE